MTIRPAPDIAATALQSLSRGIVSGERCVSSGEIEQRSRRIAGGLQRFGVGAGDCVALLMRNDIAFLEASYAAMTLGAYAVPLNWHFRPEEIDFVLRDCGAKVLIGHADLVQELQASIPAGVLTLSVETPPEVRAAYGLSKAQGLPPGMLDLATWIESQAPYDGPSLPAPQSMIYTSGTTGHPKGVRRKAPSQTEQVATERLREMVYGTRRGMRGLLPGPLYHSAPNSFALRAGRLGGVLVLMPRFDAEEMLRLIEAERIDTIFMVPTMFIRLLKLPEAVRQRYDISSLRHVIHAAAPCPADVKAAMIDWFGPIVFEFYGGTETGPVTFATSEDALRKPGTVGRPSPGAEIRILDDDGNPVPRGTPGEIYARIEGYPDFTYHKNPAKRAEVERDGLITCGDVGYLDEDDYLFICDRKRDMVISGGVNIYPAEIEAALQQIAGVHDCAVFGIPDAEFGEALLGVVEPAPNVQLDPEAVRTELARHLAGYKVPKRIEIQHGLPREDSGKIFKRRLRDPYWAAAGRKI